MRGLRMLQRLDAKNLYHVLRNGEKQLSQRQRDQSKISLSPSQGGPPHSSRVSLTHTPVKRRFKSIDHNQKEEGGLPSHRLPNLISLASQKSRPQAKSVRTLHDDEKTVAKKVEHFSLLAKAYSNGPENFSSKPSYQGVKSLLQAARGNQDFKSILNHYKSAKELPPVSYNPCSYELKMPKIAPAREKVINFKVQIQPKI